VKTKSDKARFLALISSKPFKFWACSNKSHKHVKWIGNTAICEECGATSEDKKNDD
jgi:hypothetical protein